MANIKYKENGEYKDIVVKVGDTLPIGAIIEFDTTGTIPNGWEIYESGKIKKIAPVTPANGNIKNTYGTSQTDTYSQEYINGLHSVTNYLSSVTTATNINIVTGNTNIFALNNDGLVTINTTIKPSATISTGQTLLTLPATMKPNKNLQLMARANSGTTNHLLHCYLRASTGEIVLSNPPSLDTSFEIILVTSYYVGM